MDRMAGLQDLQDRSLGAKLGTNNGHDYKIYRVDCFKLNRALTMDRI